MNKFWIDLHGRKRGCVESSEKLVSNPILDQTSTRCPKKNLEFLLVIVAVTPSFFGTPCIISISISYSILGRKGRWKFILKMFRFKWENDWCMACCILSLDIKCEMLNKFTLHVSSIIVTNVFCGKTGE